MFGREKVVTVAVNTSDLIEIIPQTVKRSVMESTFSGRNLPMGIVDDLVQGIDRKMKSALAYAKKKYYLGMPEGSFTFIGLDPVTIKSVIEQFEYGTISLVSLVTERGLHEAELRQYFLNQLHTHPDSYEVDRPPTDLQIIRDTFLLDVLSMDLADIPAVEQEYSGSEYHEVSDNGVTTITEITRTAVAVPLYNSVLNPADAATFQLTEVTLHTEELRRWVGGESGAEEVAEIPKEYAVELEYTITAEVEVFYSIQVTEEITVTVTSPSGTQTNSHTIHYPMTGTTQTEATLTGEYHETVPVERFDDKVYLVAEYDVTVDDRTWRRSWIYDIESRRYPQINLIQKESLEDTFFPIIPLRLNNVDLSEEAGTERKRTTQALLRRMGLSFNQLAGALNENPDVDQIDHAFLAFGVNLQTEHPMGKEYLYRFFDLMASRSSYGKSAYDNWYQDNTRTLTAQEISERGIVGQIPGVIMGFGQRTPSRNLLRIQEAGYDLELGWNYVEKVTKTGSIGSVKTVTLETVIQNELHHTHDYVHPDTLNDSTNYRNVTVDTSLYIIRKQISTNSYEEIIVHGLRSINHVYDRHSVTTSLEDSIREADKNFLIPLYRPVVDSFRLIERDKLYHESIKLVMYSYEVTKLKWYQSSFFKFIMNAIAIVILAYTGMDFTSFLSNLGAAASAGVMAFAQFLMKEILYQFIIQTGLEFAVKALGEELSMVIAVVAVAVGLAAEQQWGSVNRIPFVDQFMAAGTGLTRAIQQTTAKSAAELSKEFTAFSEMVDSKMGELEEISKQFELSGNLDPMLFTGLVPIFVSGETADEYYFRTLGASNMGDMAIEAVYRYFDIMLSLPESREVIRPDTGETENV